jgi:long-chain acyl-CoA synthetase
MAACIPSAFTLRQVIGQSAARFPERPAVSDFGDAPMSYREFHESVQGLSHWLGEQGIVFGDSVAILAENSAHWAMAYFAVTSMGAVAVPILIEFHSDAVVHIIRHSEAKAVFVSEKLFPKIEDADLNPFPLLISLESFSPISRDAPRDTLKELKSKGMREFRKWKELALRFANQSPAEPGEDDVAAIIYTSGTTGHSKGVMLTHKNIVSNVAAVHDVVAITENDRMLSILPLPHTFACTLGLVLPILYGMHVYFLDRPPTPRVLLPALAEVRPTVMLAVPLIMEKIYKTSVLPKLTGNALSRKLYAIPFIRKLMHRAAGGKLRAAVGGELWSLAIGGAPLAADAECFLREAGFPFTVGYGLTESSPILTGTAPAYARPASAGKPLKGVSIRLDNVNPATGEGEILAKGPNIMRGYFKLPEITREVLSEDGWLRTGDLGALDEDGYIYIKGRSKNVVIGPSGENIYPEELESFFFSSPYVLEVLVYQHEGKLTARVHLDSSRLDEVFANVPTSEADSRRRELLEDIRRSVNLKVSSFSRILKIVEQVEPFEKTPTQKIKRYLYVDA